MKRAILEKEYLEKQSIRAVDVVWIVFDKDDADFNETRILRFLEAFELANEHDFKIAYSNEVFELWLLLHLTDIDPAQPLPRGEIYERLANEIRSRPGYENFIYVHGNENVLKVIKEIGDEQAALHRAAYLINFQSGKHPIDCNPVTYVGELILDLYSWIEYYSYKG